VSRDESTELRVPAMPTMVVRCNVPGCGEPASYKIAAPWSDGAFTELKTYGHACSDHLGFVFRESEQRREAYVPLPSELQRLWGLEENYRS